MDDNNTTGKSVKAETAKAVSAKKELPRWLRITLKTAAWIAGSLIALFVIILCLAAWILTPERLTPLVEQVANESLNAEVKLKKAELTVWKTFPYLTVEADGVNIRSNSLKGYKGELPADVDSLLSVGRLKVAVNILKAPFLRIDVKEILVDSPKANIVVVNDSLNNYSIFPESEKKEEDEESSTSLSSLILREMRITHNQGLRLRHLPSGIDLTLESDSLMLDYGDKGHYYTTNFHGMINAKMPEYGVDKAIPYQFKGKVKWDITEPEDLRLREFEASIADITTKTDADIELRDQTIVKKLDTSVGPVLISKLIGYVPDKYRTDIDKFDTDLSINAKFHLVKPWNTAGNDMPTFTADISIPDCYVAIRDNKDARIDDVTLNANLNFNGEKTEESKLTVSKLLLDGFGIRLNATGSAVNLLKDPNVNAKIAGNVELARLLNILPEKMPFDVSGEMGINTSLQFAISDLTVSTFHRMKVNGEVTLQNLRYSVPSDQLTAFANHSTLKFGTDSKIKAGNLTHNMLMASVEVDSAIVTDPAGRVTVAQLRAGVGSLGSINNLMDTTQITPLGGRIRAGRISVLSLPDSSRINVAGLETDASIRRFGNGRSPQLNFEMKVEKLRMFDKTMMVSLTDGDISLTANRSAQPQRRPRPTASDSIRFRRAMQADTTYSLDLALDNQWRKVVRNWDLSGKITAERGRLFTPYFPVRNHIHDLDVSFNTKRLDINNLLYEAGNSDITLTGYVDNIRSTLLGFKRNPLTINLKAQSSLLDLNELMAAMYKGNNYADSHADGAFVLSDNVSEDHLQRKLETSAENNDTTRLAILIPTNIVVDIDVRNNKTLYSDLELHNLHSSLGIKNGVLRLRDLSTHSDEGSLKLDLVYATADRNDIGVGLVMDLNDIKVGKLLKLMPELDSIMPMMKGIDGIINARLAATTRVDSLMNIQFPATNAALNISGKDLVLLDSETFNQVAKILRFKNRERNLIDSLSVEATVLNSQLDVYPFILRIDRYKLAVAGWNDFETNYKYHISVLDSPIFFKFGINLKGNIMQDKMKWRLGRAKLREKTIAKSSAITDSTKRNLFSRMEEVFRLGAEAGLRNDRARRRDDDPKLKRPDIASSIEDEELTPADSLELIRAGIIEKPDTIATAPVATDKQTKTKGRKAKKERKPVSTRKQDGVAVKEED